MAAQTKAFGNLIFGLADSGQPNSQPIDGTYPVISRDAGQTWHINGPKLHIDAAQGASFLSHITASSPTHVVLWGGWLVTTRDGGAHWTGARPGQVIYRAFYRPGELIADTSSGEYAQRRPIRWEIWRYRSRDGGLTWRYVGQRPPVSARQLYEGGHSAK